MTDDLRRMIAKRSDLAAGILAIPTLIAFLGEAWWVFDLAAHFRVQYVLCGLVCLAGSLLAPSWRAAIAAVPLAVNLACVVPRYLGSHDEAVSGQRKLVIASFNVHTTNEEKEAVVRFLAGSNADVVFLYEVDRPWVDAMSRLPDEYRIVRAIPSRDNFGIVAIARVEVTSHRVLDLSPLGVPSIELTIPWDGREVVLLGTHTLPPMSGDYARARNEHLENLALWSARTERPHALVGDLNVTSWSPHFEALVERSRLSDAARDWQPTWPSALPSFLRIPIDHALLSPELVPVGLELGDSCGSDHLLLLLSVVIDS